MEIYKEFSFNAAHQLSRTPEGHKCRNMHGHTYTVIVHLAGPVQEKTGWVADFGEIKKSFQPIFEKLDHNCLNDIDGLENPTSENIARWIWQGLKPSLPMLSKIVIRETATCGAIYCGEDE